MPMVDQSLIKKGRNSAEPAAKNKITGARHHLPLETYLIRRLSVDNK